MGVRQTGCVNSDGVVARAEERLRTAASGPSARHQVLRLWSTCPWGECGVSQIICIVVTCCQDGGALVV